MELFEGLPRPASQQESFEKKQQLQNCFQIRHEWFYNEPMKPDAADTRKIKALSSETASFHVSPPKACIFHSDWCVRTYSGSDVFDWRICINCVEMEVDGPVTFHVCHVDAKTFDPLKELLNVTVRIAPLPMTTSMPNSSACD